MREWIDIIEAVTAKYLYHGTSVIGFCHIASDNMLGAYGGENQVSFSLSPDVAQKFSKKAVSLCADGQLVQFTDFHSDPNNKGWDGKPYVAYKAEMIAGGQGVVLEFDRAALHRDYDFKAVNFASDSLQTVDLGYSGDEQEECVFKDVRNLDRYVTRVIIDREGFFRYAEFVRKALPDDAMAMKAVRAGEAWVTRFA